MSDEENEEKKEQAPPKPWLWAKLDEINLSISSKQSKPKEIATAFAELFENITPERYYLEDEVSKNYEDYLKKANRRGFKIADVLTFFREPPNIKELLNASISHLAHTLNHTEKADQYVLHLWNSWWTSRSNPNILLAQQEVIDCFALMVLSQIVPNEIKQLYRDTLMSDYSIHELLQIAQRDYLYKSMNLELIGTILEKLEEYNWFLTNAGKNFRARAQALTVKEELEKETLGPFRKFTDETKQELAQLKKDTEERTKELHKGIDDAKENENRMTRNFVQIIGIFAAIIAFIVTIVPTAVRLGGASIPIALAGLAIVTAGIILLLAMIFGSKENNKPRQGLTWGLVATIALFVGWFIYTMVLAHQKPTPLISPPEASKVERIYQYQPRVDTVKTIITQPEGK